MSLYQLQYFPEGPELPSEQVKMLRYIALNGERQLIQYIEQDNRKISSIVAGCSYMLIENSLSYDSPPSLITFTDQLIFTFPLSSKPFLAWGGKPALQATKNPEGRIKSNSFYCHCPMYMYFSQQN